MTNSKMNLILEGLSSKKQKLSYKDFTMDGIAFRALSDIYYGSLDSEVPDREKARKMGFKIEKVGDNGYYEVSIKKDTILKATGKSDRTGVYLKVNGITLSFADPAEMDVEKL